jgi:Uma2 family endonuclease
MEVTLRLSRRASYADYLTAEQSSDCRYELLDGVIVAMPGSSDEQSAIAGKIAGLLGNAETRSCFCYSSHQRFWIASRVRSRHADISIICGPPEHPAHDAQATTNPAVVIELLPPSSEGDDHGDRRADFQSLASRQAYVLVAQDQRRVKVYRRTGREWSVAIYRDGDSFELPTLSAPIPVSDIYHGVLDPTGRSLFR